MTKNTIIGLIAFVLAVSNVLAFNVTIDVKESFSKGENILFGYSIISDQDTNISLSPGVYCPNAPIIENEEIIISLKKGETHSKTYKDFSITDAIEPQVCKAYIEI